MRLKVAILGLLVSAAVAVPVLASAIHTSNRPNGTSVYYTGEDGENPPSGLFANWTNRPYMLSFGISDNNDELSRVGLRVSCPAGQAAQSFQLDVNTTNQNAAFLAIFATL